MIKIAHPGFRKINYDGKHTILALLASSKVQLSITDASLMLDRQVFVPLEIAKQGTLHVYSAAALYVCSFHLTTYIIRLL